MNRLLTLLFVWLTGNLVAVAQPDVQLPAQFDKLLSEQLVVAQ